MRDSLRLLGFFAVSGFFAASGLLPPLPYFLLRLFLRRRERKSERNFKKPLADPAVYGANAQAQHNSLAAPTSCGILCGFRLLCGFRPLAALPYFLLRLFLRRRERKVKGILKSLWPTRLYTARTRRRNTTALRLQPLAGFFAASRLLCGFRPLAAPSLFSLAAILAAARKRE